MQWLFITGVYICVRLNCPLEEVAGTVCLLRLYSKVPSQISHRILSSVMIDDDIYAATFCSLECHAKSQSAIGG